MPMPAHRRRCVCEAAIFANKIGWFDRLPGYLPGYLSGVFSAPCFNRNTRAASAKQGGTGGAGRAFIKIVKPHPP